jgi:hypothetical protein
LNVKTDKGFASGKRTQDSPTIWTGSKDQRSSSNNDKKEGQDSGNITIPPFFHINSCTMENNYDNVAPPLTIEEIRNLDLSNIDPTPTKIYDKLNRVLGEAQYSEQCGNTTENALAGPSNQLGPHATVEVDKEERT